MAQLYVDFIKNNKEYLGTIVVKVCDLTARPCLNYISHRSGTGTVQWAAYSPHSDLTAPGAALDH
jgi:hypothetical protein